MSKAGRGAEGYQGAGTRYSESLPVVSGLSLDPGGTTGICEWRNVLNSKFPRFNSFEIDKPFHHDTLYRYLSNFNPDFVVCEDFKYRNGLTKAELIPVEYIGVARLWAMNHRRPFILQQPSTKTFVDDVKLKALGLYSPGLQHARDATRHMVYYLITKRMDEYLLAKLKPNDEE